MTTAADLGRFNRGTSIAVTYNRGREQREKDAEYQRKAREAKRT